jgi:hypothetical protein
VRDEGVAMLYLALIMRGAAGRCAARQCSGDGIVLRSARLRRSILPGICGWRTRSRRAVQGRWSCNAPTTAARPGNRRCV